MSSLDIVTSQSPFRNHLSLPGVHLLYPGGTQNRSTVKLWNTNRFELSWNDQFRFPKIRQRKTRLIVDGCRAFISAVATVEQDVLVQTDELHEQQHALESKLGKLLVTLEESTSELDERERLRRIKISISNKGKIPWNKGRKHSPETVQRIRERTWLAMQDPKVKMKLSNIGHAQSEETRLKIGIGVRERWLKRRQKLMVQELCCLEWQNTIAEISKVGYGGEEALQWDSYKILNEQLEKEWRESVEQRKLMPRPKGSKRAPKSLEQRKKISLAILAKWTDPAYRERVCSGISKYHGAAVGVERKSRKKSCDTAPTSAKKTARRKSKESDTFKFEDKKAIPEKKGPSYKDPMARSKLEMIKQIKMQRMEMENRKREATERAKLLIAEAEKAAQALEVAALTSLTARASLLESRKLIAEAIRSIERTEKGLLPSDNCISPNLDSTGDINNYDATIHGGSTRHHTVRDDVPHVNGDRQLTLIERSESDFQFDKFTMQDTLNGNVPSPCISGDSEISIERDRDELIMQQPLLVNHASDRLGMASTTSCLLPDLEKASSSSVSEESVPKLPDLQQQNNHVRDDKSDMEPTSTGSSLPLTKQKRSGTVDD